MATNAQIDIHISTIVHAELAARDHHNTVLNASYMNRSFNPPTDKKTFVDFLDG
jgi:hypothetical protein